MTIEELQAQRDQILKQMADPQDVRAGSAGVTNRSQDDLRKALAVIDAEIKRAGGSSGVSCTFLKHSKG